MSSLRQQCKIATISWLLNALLFFFKSEIILHLH